LQFKRAKRLSKIKKHYKMDCVISFLTNANIINALSKVVGTSTVFSIRNFSVLEKDLSFLSKIEDTVIKKQYKKADMIIPVSFELANNLKKEDKIPDEKIKVIYNPYNIAEIKDLASQKIIDKDHDVFFNKGSVFITVGRLSYQKAHWHLVKALSLIPKELNAKLVIIGEGEKRINLEKLISQLNLKDKVLLVGYQKNPFQYIARSYAFVLSSLFEGFPNALVEAMAIGCAVIAADCKSGPKEILYEKMNLHNIVNNMEYADYGIMVPNLEMEENWSYSNITYGEQILAKAMEKLIIDVDLKENYIKNGNKCAKKFSYKLCLEQYSEVIEKCIMNN
jgi:glycosyltransferase involved in cell wall biosynthesis